MKDRLTLILSSSLVVVTLVVRLLLISNYQAPTAVAVAAAVGPLSTLLGTLLPVAQGLLPIVSTGVFIGAGFALLKGWSRLARRLLLVGLLGLVVVLLITPTTMSWSEVGLTAANAARVARDLSLVFLAGLVLLVLAILIVLGLVFRKRLHRKAALEGVAGAGVIVFAGSLIIFALGQCVGLLVSLNMVFPVTPQIPLMPGMLRSMWLPTEELRLTAPDEITTGYVLKVSDGWFTLLTEDKRVVEILRADRVVERTVCRLGPQTAMPLIPLPGAQVPSVPKCPA